MRFGGSVRNYNMINLSHLLYHQYGPTRDRICKKGKLPGTLLSDLVALAVCMSMG